MKNIIKISVVTTLLLSSLNAQEVEPEAKKHRIHSVRQAVDNIAKIDDKEVFIVDDFRNMFKDGKVSGRIRMMYAANGVDEPNADDTYATAFGGIIKYELANYNGFNAAAAVYTSHDITAASGSKTHHNPELSSSSGSYTEMAEAYINYKYKGLNLRAGRQKLETPLADTDDIRMIQNSFEAYVGTYSYADVEFMIGYLQSWQGADADLDRAWHSIADHGTSFSGISYRDSVEFNLWYYNISDLTNALYSDVGLEYPFNDDILLHLGAQILNEEELADSQVAATIYGGLFEFIYHDIGFNIAFNHSLKREGKQSFSGTGGGTMYTSMDTMIIDVLADDREVFAYVAGISYSIDYFNFLYAHGDFVGKENSNGVKEHVLEHNMGFSYEVNEEFLISAIYAISEDKESDVKTVYDFDRVQFMVNYNF